MDGERGSASWGRMVRWGLFLGCAVGGFAYYRMHREAIHAWMDRPLNEMVQDTAQADPAQSGRGDTAIRQEQQAGFEERRRQAEEGREARLRLREERQAAAEEREQELLWAVDAARGYLDERALLKAQGMDPWSDPASCRCEHRGDAIVSLGESRASVRSRYSCEMDPKQEDSSGTRSSDAPVRRARRAQTVEVEASFEKDASGTWQYLGPRP